MRAGRLSKVEIGQLRRAWAILDGLQTKLPATGSETERCTLEHFVDARNKTADLLRWQNPAWRTLVAK